MRPCCWALLEGRGAADLREASLKGMRLLVLDDGLVEAEDAPAAGFDSAVSRLSAAGARITHATLPCVGRALALSATVFTPEAYGIWREVIEAAPEKMYPPILERFRSGAATPAADFVAAWRLLRDLRADWAAAVAPYDAVILPTAPILPPNVERLDQDRDYYVRANLLTLRNTRIGNLMGLCALTLPTGVPSTGIMVMGAPAGEEKLLRIGAAAEAALH